MILLKTLKPGIKLINSLFCGIKLVRNRITCKCLEYIFQRDKFNSFHLKHL